MTPEEPDWSAMAESMEMMRRAFARFGERMVESMRGVAEWCDTCAIPLMAEAGIAEIEMGLKLRDEVGLRTDLLALFDDEDDDA